MNNVYFLHREQIKISLWIFLIFFRLRDSRVRKREHINKTRGDWGEDWRRSFLPLSPFLRVHARKDYATVEERQKKKHFCKSMYMYTGSRCCLILLQFMCFPQIFPVARVFKDFSRRWILPHTCRQFYHRGSKKPLMTYAVCLLKS